MTYYFYPSEDKKPGPSGCIISQLHSSRDAVLGLGGGVGPLAGGRDVIIMWVINIIIQMSLGCYNLVIRWSRQSTPDHSPHTARKKDLLSTYGVYATHITHCHVSYISNSISVDIHVKNL